MTLQWANGQEFKGQRFVVTGGGSGIGKALCLSLHDAGAKVLAVSHVFEEECFAGRDVLQLKLDLLEENAAQRVVAHAHECLGGCDGLINNAARMVKKRVGELSPADLREIFSLNVEVCHQLSAGFAAQWMQHKQSGVIVNMSSYLAKSHFTGSAAYSASKTALESLTRSMALEWGRYGVRVNAVAPGWVLTDMTRSLLEGPAGGVLKSQNPMRRLGQVDDIVAAIEFLLSARSGYINGAILPVDGGQHLA